MDLIHKENGFFAVTAPVGLCLLHHFFHVLLTRHCGVQLAEIGLGGMGNDPSQGGFSRSRRAVEDERAKLVRLDGPVEQLVLSHNMLLSHHLIQRLRPHAGSQRRFLLFALF